MPFTLGFFVREQKEVFYTVFFVPTFTPEVVIAVISKLFACTIICTKVKLDLKGGLLQVDSL